MASFRPMTLLKRMMGANSDSESKMSVAVGDKYEQLDPGLSVWVVERISNVSASSLPLISLSREGHPDLKKVLSLTVLEEGVGFRPALH